MAGAAAAVDGVFARIFRHLVGAWPKQPPQAEEE